MNQTCTNIFITLFIIFLSYNTSKGLANFKFDIHHRYSEPVKNILDLNGLPQKGTSGYYSAMAHRDRVFRGRKLTGSASVAGSGLGFFPGNETYRLSSLGFLHYANVSVGTPSLSFLVALDTGSDLFWLPCDCISCVQKYKTKSGKEFYFNIYSPSTSSTSEMVSCNSSFCTQQNQCLYNTCAYEVNYLSGGTSSSGLLVEDTLHLITNDNKEKAVDARITFGCGMVETGSFLKSAAPNGLIGLGMDNVSIPSILASKDLATNSFSMCFGDDGTGRISFGDNGSSGQSETPFNFKQRQYVRQSNLHFASILFVCKDQIDILVLTSSFSVVILSDSPTYNVSVTKITVGDNVTDDRFTAIFDTGTSFTYLNDPAYTKIAESFTSQVQEKRHSADSGIPFEYCYDLSAIQETPSVVLTMQGGKEFNVTDPVVVVSDENGSDFYCLALVKSEDIDIIGRYNIVFNRENMVLGWEASDCYDTKTSSLLPISPSKPRSAPPPASLDPSEPSPMSAKSPPPSNSSLLLNPTFLHFLWACFLSSLISI